MTLHHQQFTSAKTSRAQIPALHKALVRAKVWTPWDTNADIGGGRFELASDYLEEHGVINIVYDPFNRSAEHNEIALQALAEGTTTATVTNVLNVIAEPGNRRGVIEMAATVVAPNRVAYFDVYEGDRTGVGNRTRDGWQENRKLLSYVSEIEPYFKSVTVVIVAGVRCIAAHGSRLVV